MTYTLRFLPEVEDDAVSGYSWYESKSPGLGEEFLRMPLAMKRSTNGALLSWISRALGHK